MSFFITPYTTRWLRDRDSEAISCDCSSAVVRRITLRSMRCCPPPVTAESRRRRPVSPRCMFRSARSDAGAMKPAGTARRGSEYHLQLGRLHSAAALMSRRKNVNLVARSQISCMPADDASQRSRPGEPRVAPALWPIFDHGSFAARHTANARHPTSYQWALRGRRVFRRTARCGLKSRTIAVSGQRRGHKLVV